MLKHHRRRATQYRPTTPMRPTIAAPAAMVPGHGGVGASAALALLPDARGIAFVAPPCFCPHGARNAAARGLSATC